MDRRTRREHFSSAAFSIADDLLHRNILLLRATSGLTRRSKTVSLFDHLVGAGEQRRR
jgi:hypothetical protein